MYLDIHVTHNVTPSRHECYEVFLIIFEQDFMEDRHSEVRNYIINLAKYMDVRLCGIYKELVTEEEWEEMKSDETP